MAGKITIRRVGSVLPTVCLLLFLVVCLCVIWLSTQGFPSSVMRYVEQEAAKQGISLRVGGLWLEPQRGLAVRAQDVRVYTDAEAAQSAPDKPLATLQRLTLSISATHLALGELRPKSIRLEQGELHLPVTDIPGEFLTVQIVDLAARVDMLGVAQITSGNLKLQDIPIKLQGSVDPAALRSQDRAASSKPDIAELLEQHRDLINQIYSQIDAQHWHPHELPSLETRLDLREQTRISLRSYIPRFDIGQFHFRDSALDILINRGVITINSLRFNTVDPEASATIQGGYDTRDKRLSFNMKSNAAVLRMVRQMSDEDTRSYLAKFRHPDDCPPQITLSGDVVFEDDFSLNSARIRGNVLQQELMVGSVRVNDIELSFFYNNGDFNIDKFELRFSDGTLQGIASAQDGVGQAQVAADLPVQKVLDLVSELTDSSVELPAGVTLGERVNIQAHAQLTTPKFKPGQTQWQGFVPSFHMLGVEFRSDALEYADCKLAAPHLSVKMEDIEQWSNMLPKAIETLRVSLSANEVDLMQEAAPKAMLHRADAELIFSGIAMAEDGLPRTVRQADVKLSLEQLTADMLGRLMLSKPELTMQMHGLSMGKNPSYEDACIETLQAHAHADAAECAIGDRPLHCGQLELTLADLRKLAPFGKADRLFSSAELHLAARDMMQGDTRIGNADLQVELQEYAKGSIALRVRCHESDAEASISAMPDWSNPEEIVLHAVSLSVPESIAAMALELTGVELADLELPEQMKLSGECVLSAADFSLIRGNIHVDLPELVRTPHRIHVFSGQKIPLAVKAQVDFISGSDAPHYRADLQVVHETGEFRGVIEGSLAGYLRVNGSNTIRPDVVDMLIDNDDAHSIIRDFSFPEGSGATISDIDARIDYSAGLRVDSFCRVELRNTEYLISAIEDTPEGGERLRTDLGSLVHALVSHATCTVKVKVIEGCTAKDGTPIPNESEIVIGSPVLVYDNRPWIRKNRFSNGVYESRLEGEEVIIDIEHSFVELRQVKGTLYPAYSLGMFYPPLRQYLEDVLLSSPVQIETPSCVFPIYDDCVRPMSGAIRVLSPKNAAFRFLGTTIPLHDFSGFISLSDTHVLLDRMNAKCWEGVLNASVKIGISGSRTSFDGYVTAECMNLQKIAAAYGSKQAPALCSGNIRFRTPSPRVKDIRAYGRVDVEDGDLMSLSIFRPVSELISDLPGHFTRLEQEVIKTDSSHQKTQSAKPGFISRMFTGIFKGLGRLVGTTGGSISKTASYIPGMNHLIAYDLQEAHANFDIINGHLITRNMKAKGYNLNVQLNMDMDLDTLELQGNLWPAISSLPTVLLAPLTFLSDFMVDIIVYGKVDDIKWRIGLQQRKPSQPPSATSAPDPHIRKPRAR